ncbi:MAG: hypothetical protein WBQ10_13600 [Terriglobales bacterium]
MRGSTAASANGTATSPLEEMARGTEGGTSDVGTPKDDIDDGELASAPGFISNGA